MSAATTTRRIVLGVVALMVVGAVGALAFWTASGSGTASAAAGTLSASGKPAPTAVSATSVTMQWTGASVSGGGGIDYAVERKLDSGSTWSGTVCSTTAASGVTASCSSTGATPGEQYVYRVIADVGGGSWTSISPVSDAVDIPTLATAVDHFEVSAPASTTAGSAFSLTVVAKSATNTTVTGYTGIVTFTSSDGQAVLPGDYTFTAGDNGSKTFTNAVTLKTAGSQSITATDTVTAKTGSTSVTVNAAAASKLAFTTQPSNTAATQTITPSVVAQIQDSFGNPVSSSANVTMAIGTNPASGTLSGTTTRAAVNGVATFNDLSIDKAGTGYTLAASSAGLTGATSSSFNITVGAAAKLAFTQQPSASSVSNTAFASQPKVEVQDAGGNVVTGNTSSVTLAITTGTGASGAVLTCTTNPIAAVAGVATFAGCNVDKAGTGYTLTATSGSLTAATSSSFNITAGAASKLAFTQQPGGSTGGVALSPQPKVTVQDAAGNTVASSSAPITVAIGTNPSSGALSGTTTVNAVNGVATFSGLSIDKAGTGYTLTAASSGLTGATSNTFNITVGPASRLVLSAATTTPTAGAANNLTITAQDAGGNTVTGYTGPKNLTFSGSTSSASGTSPTVSNSAGAATNFGSSTAITFASGVATTSGPNNGVMRLYKAGAANIVVSDGTIGNGSGLAVTVAAAAPSVFQFTRCSVNSGAQSPTCVGTVNVGSNGRFDAFVGVLDSFGNTATVSGGALTVTLTKGAPNPGDFTLTPGSVSIPVGASESSAGFSVTNNGTANRSTLITASGALTSASITVSK